MLNKKPTLSIGNTYLHFINAWLAMYFDTKATNALLWFVSSSSQEILGLFARIRYTKQPESYQRQTVTPEICYFAKTMGYSGRYMICVLYAIRKNMRWTICRIFNDAICRMIKSQLHINYVFTSCISYCKSYAWQVKHMFQNMYFHAANGKQMSDPTPCLGADMYSRVKLAWSF